MWHDIFHVKYTVCWLKKKTKILWFLAKFWQIDLEESIWQQKICWKLVSQCCGIRKWKASSAQVFWLSEESDIHRLSRTQPNLLFATCSHPRAVSGRLFFWRVNLGSWFGWKVAVSVRLFSVSLAARAGLQPGWTNCCIRAGEGKWRNAELLLQLLPPTAAHGALHSGQDVGLTQCEKQFESTVFTEFSSFILSIR